MSSHRRIAFAILSIILATGVPAFSHGWGKTGHRVSGAIADPYLTPSARAAVAAILGVEDLAEASTWPDFMRSSPEGIWPRTANPWHYVTIPKGQHYRQIDPPAEGDAITALTLFRGQVLNPELPLEDRALALRFIIHIIGDLHQPLHAGNGRDRGGNDFSVTFFGASMNLHSVWDYAMIDHSQLSYTEMSHWLARRITPAMASAWQQTDPAIWADESAALRDELYPRDRDLRWDYIFQHRATYRTRLQQAGVRLAAYLNELFAPAS